MKTRPVDTHSIAWLMPTIRGRNQLEHASGTMPRRAKTNPILAPSATSRMSIGKRHRDADSDRRPIDRRDHRLQRVEDAQRNLTAGVTRYLVPRLAVAPVERVAAPAQVGAGAEAPALAGDDDRAHVVVGIGAVEGLDQLPAHRRA